MPTTTHTKVVLHYGGREYDIDESQKNVLDEMPEKSGAVKLNIGGGRWLTVVIGPGIPVAILETPIYPAVPTKVR